MGRTEETLHQRIGKVAKKREVDPAIHRSAKRTAFVARFIVLREGRRSRAHREIEHFCWSQETTAEELYKMFKQAFLDNGDKMQPVERDLRRALEHANYSADYFADQYSDRSNLNFREALLDYARSNKLLFGDQPEGADAPRRGGWRLYEHDEVD